MNPQSEHLVGLHAEFEGATTGPEFDRPAERKPKLAGHLGRLAKDL
jgi:hypothetical protein